MSELFVRYLIGLLVGTCTGLAFPSFASWWLVLGIVVVVVLTEAVGRWGFSSEHWREYRSDFYVLYTGVAFFAVFGILLGSGALGRMLILVGRLIS